MSQALEQSQPASEPRNSGKQRSSIFTSVYMDLLGLGLMITTGIGTAVMIIKKSFFANLEDDVKHGKMKTLDSIAARDAKRAEIPLDKNWQQEIMVAEKEYAEQLPKDLEKIGAKNIFGKWNSLRHHQKWEAGLAMAAVSAVAIGAIFNFMNERDIILKQKELELRLSNQEQRNQR